MYSRKLEAIEGSQLGRVTSYSTIKICIITDIHFDFVSFL